MCWLCSQERWDELLCTARKITAGAYCLHDNNILTTAAVWSTLILCVLLCHCFLSDIETSEKGGCGWWHDPWERKIQWILSLRPGRRNRATVTSPALFCKLNSKHKKRKKEAGRCTFSLSGRLLHWQQLAFRKKKKNKDACVCACVRACVRVCVRACLCVCGRAEESWQQTEGFSVFLLLQQLVIGGESCYGGCFTHSHCVRFRANWKCNCGASVSQNNNSALISLPTCLCLCPSATETNTDDRSNTQHWAEESVSPSLCWSETEMQTVSIFVLALML